jgi:hypothetical protein
MRYRNPPSAERIADFKAACPATYIWEIAAETKKWINQNPNEVGFAVTSCEIGSTAYNASHRHVVIDVKGTQTIGLKSWLHFMDSRLKTMLGEVDQRISVSTAEEERAMRILQKSLTLVLDILEEAEKKVA